MFLSAVARPSPNNLGLFWALNCLCKKIVAKNVEGLIDAVSEAYNRIPACTFDNAFITLMAQINEILHHGGGNNFPLPHTHCRKHEKEMKRSIKLIKADIPEFVPTSSALPLFTFDNVNVCSNNKTNKEDKSVAVAAPTPNKTEQAAFEAALKQPVAFHQ